MTLHAGCTACRRTFAHHRPRAKLSPPPVALSRACGAGHRLDDRLVRQAIEVFRNRPCRWLQDRGIAPESLLLTAECRLVMANRYLPAPDLPEHRSATLRRGWAFRRVAARCSSRSSAAAAGPLVDPALFLARPFLPRIDARFGQKRRFLTIH